MNQVFDITPQIWQIIDKYSERYNVDPYLLAAIGQHETAWGRLGVGRSGVHMGYGAFDSGTDFRWAGLERQIREVAHKMSRWGMTPEKTTIERLRLGNIGQLPSGIYATDEKWPEKVWNWRNKIISRVDNLTGINTFDARAAIERGRENPIAEAWIDRINPFIEENEKTEGKENNWWRRTIMGIIDPEPPDGMLRWWKRLLIILFGIVFLLLLGLRLLDLTPTNLAKNIIGTSKGD